MRCDRGEGEGEGEEEGGDGRTFGMERERICTRPVDGNSATSDRRVLPKLGTKHFPGIPLPSGGFLTQFVYVVETPHLPGLPR
jgi:hypothetical protein